MTFDQLIILARTVIEAVQRRLPANVREAAEAVPVSLESYPSDDLVADGVEPDTLGLFVGQEHRADSEEIQPMPPQILLFVENIWDLAGNDETAYRDEVRLTYLHELGHYLGWNEDEIARRGLE